MTLIAILCALLALRAKAMPNVVAERVWTERYVNWWESRSWFQSRHPLTLYGAIVVPPMLVLWWVGTYQQGGTYALVDGIIALLMLTTALAYRTMDTAVQPFLRRWRNQEWQAAYEHGAQYFQYSRMISPAELLSQTVTEFLILSNRFLFAPLLWFALFGTAGLALYLLTLTATHQGFKELKEVEETAAWRRIAQEFLHGMDGLAARLVAMSMALLTLNGKALAVSVRRFRVTDREAEIVLKLAARMALEFSDLPEESEALASEGVRRVHAVQDLRTNILILWLLVIGFLTLAGWIF